MRLQTITRHNMSYLAVASLVILSGLLISTQLVGKRPEIVGAPAPDLTGQRVGVDPELPAPPADGAALEATMQSIPHGLSDAPSLEARSAESPPTVVVEPTAPTLGEQPTSELDPAGPRRFLLSGGGEENAVDGDSRSAARGAVSNPVSDPEPTQVATGPIANQPPELPSRVIERHIPVGTQVTLFTDGALSAGWRDPDNTADWLCLTFTPERDDWWLDGADCRGAGLHARVSEPGEYVVHVRAREATTEHPGGIGPESIGEVVLRLIAT